MAEKSIVPGSGPEQLSGLDADRRLSCDALLALTDDRERRAAIQLGWVIGAGFAGMRRERLDAAEGSLLAGPLDTEAAIGGELRKRIVKEFRRRLNAPNPQSLHAAHAAALLAMTKSDSQPQPGEV